MNNKNNKNIRRLLIVIVFLISVFSFNSEVSAIKMTSVRPSIHYSYQYNSKNMNNKARTLADSFVFVVQDDKTTKQAYCIQPGVSMAIWNSNNYTRNGNGSEPLSSYVGDNDPKNAGYSYGTFFNEPAVKSRILQILNYAYEYKPGKTNITDFSNACIDIGKDSYQKIIAAQTLVWEAVTKERTNFKTYAPDQKVSGGIYDLLSTKSDLSVAFTEYKRIVDAVYNSYYRNPGNNKNTFKID